MKILNLGAGQSKVTGAINVDSQEGIGVDLVFDIKKPFPLEDETYDKVLLFHCIEHIERKHRLQVLQEIRRVLKNDGKFYVSYPEFPKLLQNWLDNKDCNREFWEATIYGRQAYPGDYHVAAMYTPKFREHLQMMGFRVDSEFPEPSQDCNTVLKCSKTEPFKPYEQVLYEEVFLKGQENV